MNKKLGGGLVSRVEQLKGRTIAVEDEQKIKRSNYYQGGISEKINSYS